MAVSVDSTSTLPPKWYSDPEVFEREQELIFARSWQLATSEARLREPGISLPLWIAGTPVLLTRDESGEVHGFLNACRHRGYPVATEEGKRRTLRCAYHGWTYGLDGRLREAPRSEGDPCFNKGSLSLVPVSVAVWRGLVFVNLDRRAEGFLETYPELEELASVRALDLGDFTYFTSSETQVEANWKAWTENLNECYHCSVIHKKSFGDAWDVVSDAYEWVTGENVIGQFARPNPRAQYFKQATGTMANIFIWPGTAISTDDFVGVGASIVPLSAERTAVISHLYARKGVKAATLREWFEMYDLTMQEDVDAVELQHRALKARNFVSGRLMPAAEPGVARFQALIRSALAPADGDA